MTRSPLPPFVSGDVGDRLGLDAGDPRRAAVRLANPLSEDEAYLRTTLLPGLLAAVVRNAGRGRADLSLFETGLVFRWPGGGPAASTPRPPVPSVLHRPVRRGDPRARRRAAPPAAARGGRPVRPAAAGRLVGCRARRRLGRRRGSCPHRCQVGPLAAGRLLRRRGAVPSRPVRRVAGAAAGRRCGHRDRRRGRGRGGAYTVVGHAGELHPRVTAAFEVPARTCAMELDLDALIAAADDRVQAPLISPYPPADRDVALVVDPSVAVAEVAHALRAGLWASGGSDCSSRSGCSTSMRCRTDGARSPSGSCFRAADRTLTAEEANGARDAAVAEAVARTGAVLRGTR